MYDHSAQQYVRNYWRLSVREELHIEEREVKENWYWEATWPVGKSRQDHIAFSVNEYGEAKARDLAISARNEALVAVEGAYWASARGLAGK